MNPIKKLRNSANRWTQVLGEKEQLRYLPQAARLEEGTNPHLIQLTLIMISGAIFTFLIWASFAHINEVAKAHGDVVPQGFVQVVQHFDGGIVTEIPVGEGQQVSDNQVLLKIDDGKAQQELSEAKIRQRFLALEAERISAFIEGRELDFQNFSNIALTPRSGVNGQLEIQEARERSKKMNENLRIAKEVFKMNADLYEQGYASKFALLTNQKEVSEIEGRAHLELGQVKSQLAQTNEVVKRLQNKVSRFEIRSPVQGLVKGLKVNTIGGVIEPGETLMEIVPLDKNLVVEARILPRDIGHVAVGQTVRVKISSFDFSRYGAVKGVLDFISATTFLDEQKQPYYRGRISLERSYAGSNPSANKILPGMTVQADILTGEKTLLAYLLKPIHLSLLSAFSER